MTCVIGQVSLSGPIFTLRWGGQLDQCPEVLSVFDSIQ